MITGEVRTQIDAIWDAFWSGGISNPLEVIEQITYLLRQAFSSRAATVEAMQKRYRASLAQLEPVFASLQHRAFRGEL